MRHDRYYKIPNKNFRGITMDVMDIYPVIRYSEIKYAERLTAIKEEEGKEVSPSRDMVDERVGKVATGENAEIVINVDGDKNAKGNASAPSSSGKDKYSTSNHTGDVKRKHNDVSAPYWPPKPLRKKHSYEPIDPEDIYDFSSTSKRNSKRFIIRRKSSVYEVLDLAMSSRKSLMRSRKSSLESRKSSMASHSVESPAVEALDLDNLSHFRTRCLITVSFKPFKDSGIVGNVNIARQRSLQVAEEVTKSLDGIGEVKSKTISVKPKREDIGSASSQSTSKSGESSRSSSHLSTRSCQTRISRKRYDYMLFMP